MLCYPHLTLGRHTRGTPFTYGSALDYPAPPAARPLSGSSRIDARMVLSICRDVERSVPLIDALRSNGLKGRYYDWVRSAEESSDPFWTWAVTCVDMAQGACVSELATRAHDLATDPNEPDTRVLLALLKAKSSEFNEKKVIEHTGTVEHNHNALIQSVNRRLLESQANIAGLIAGPDDVVDVEFTPAQVDADGEEIFDADLNTQFGVAPPKAAPPPPPKAD